MKLDGGAIWEEITRADRAGAVNDEHRIIPQGGITRIRLGHPGVRRGAQPAEVATRALSVVDAARSTSDVPEEQGAARASNDVRIRAAAEVYCSQVTDGPLARISEDASRARIGTGFPSKGGGSVEADVVAQGPVAIDHAEMDGLGACKGHRAGAEGGVAADADADLSDGVTVEGGGPGVVVAAGDGGLAVGDVHRVAAGELILNGQDQSRGCDFVGSLAQGDDASEPVGATGRSDRAGVGGGQGRPRRGCTRRELERREAHVGEVREIERRAAVRPEQKGAGRGRSRRVGNATSQGCNRVSVADDAHRAVGHRIVEGDVRTRAGNGSCVLEHQATND